MDEEKQATLCGITPNEADCMYCLDTYECRLMQEAMCPAEFKRKMAEAGVCRGRELAVVQEFTQLHGKGI